MTRGFQNSTSCVCPFSRRVSFRLHSIRRETPATTKQQISIWVSFPGQTEDQSLILVSGHFSPPWRGWEGTPSSRVESGYSILLKG